MVILNAGHYYHVRAGSDRYLIELELLLQQAGHEVIPFAVQDERNKPTPWASYFPEGIDPKAPSIGDALQFIYSRPARRSMKRLLQDASVDLAHLHIYYGQLTASILAPLKAAGVPVVQTLHEYKLGCPVYTFISDDEVCEACQGQHFWRALPRRCNRGSVARTAVSVVEAYVSRASGDIDRVDHFISTSHFLRKKMIELGVVPEDQITTVHNFVDAQSFEPARAPGEYVLYFGRIAPVKGLRTLVDAMGPLGDVPLLIVGEGEQRPWLEAYTKENGWDHIQFLGFKRGEDLFDLIRGSICCVLPSEWYENCPLSVLEAYALGRPMIGADIGGIPELIVDGEDGFLVPSGDTEALREKLAWMGEHRAEAVEMGQLGRRKMKEHFNPDLHLSRVMDVYKNVL